jgi:hypothetical protein
VPAFFVEGHGERLRGYAVGGIEYLFPDGRAVLILHANQTWLEGRLRNARAPALLRSAT